MTSEKMILDFLGPVWPWNKVAPYSTDRIGLRASLQSSVLLMLDDPMWFSETLAAVLMEELNEWTEMTTLLQMHLSESSAILCQLIDIQFLEEEVVYFSVCVKKCIPFLDW